MNTPMDLPAAEAAKLVKRSVPVMKDGKPTGEHKDVPIKADEVFACRVRDQDVTVITVDGQKLTSVLSAARGETK